MTQRWPDELWASGTRPPLPTTPDDGLDAQNGAQSLVVCARCDGDPDRHPTPACRLTRNQLLEIDPDAIHDATWEDE